MNILLIGKPLLFAWLSFVRSDTRNFLWFICSWFCPMTSNRKREMMAISNPSLDVGLLALYFLLPINNQPTNNQQPT